jgi:predicted metal-dependent hydrolase
VEAFVASGRGVLDLLFRPRAPSKPADRAKRAIQPVEPLTIDLGGSTVPVELRIRDNARRMILRIDRRTGNPALTVPRGVGRLRAERFLLDHAGWLAARLKAYPERVGFQPDAVIPLRGEPHRIVHCLPFRGTTRIEGDTDEKRLLVHGDPAQLAARVERFLRAEAARDLAEAVARHAGALGVSYGRISVKDTRSRWGSCSARGDLAFSWRLILAPPHVLDYLAAHEIAHRLEMNHSTRYWRHVARIFPAFRDAEAWLSRHGASLHHFGDP